VKATGSTAAEPPPLVAEARFRCQLTKTIRFDDGSRWVEFHRVMLLAGQPREGDTVFWDGDWAGEHVQYVGIGTDEIDVTLRRETYPGRDSDGFQEMARSWPKLGWEVDGL
jgi:hypothetical protein